MRWVMSFSGGKDSTAMLHVVLREKMPLDEVLFFASEWDFPEVTEHVRQVELQERISIRRILPSVSWWSELNRLGWPSPRCRWCTGRKGAALDQETHGAGKYIGYAADEVPRVKAYKAKQRPAASFPLVQYGITQDDSMSLCTRLGYTWGGLYDWLPRFSCYCCPLQSWGTLNKLQCMKPELFASIIAAHTSMPDVRQARGFKDGWNPQHTVRNPTARECYIQRARRWRKRKQSDTAWLVRERTRQRESKRRSRARRAASPSPARLAGTQGLPLLGPSGGHPTPTRSAND